MNASEARRVSSICAREKKKSLGICTLSARVDFLFSAPVGATASNFPPLLHLLTFRRSAAVYRPSPILVFGVLTSTSYHDLAQGRVVPFFGA